MGLGSAGVDGSDANGGLPPLIVNRSSGRAARGEGGALIDPFPAWLERYEQVAEVHRLAPDQINARIDQLVADGHKRIAVAGGDGTLSHCAGQLVDTDVAMVPLPLGTHNHFTKDLDIAADPEQWTDLCRDGSVSVIDVGALDDRVFLNNVSFGWHPTMLKTRERFDNERILGSKRLASMVATLLIRVRRVPQLQVRWRAAEGAAGAGLLFTKALLFSNNAYASGTLSPMSRERLDGGVLTMYALEDASFQGLTRMVEASLSGELAQCPGLTMVQAGEFDIELAARPGHVSVDGELLRASRRHRLRSLAGRLSVVVPG